MSTVFFASFALVPAYAGDGDAKAAGARPAMQRVEIRRVERRDLEADPRRARDASSLQRSYAPVPPYLLRARSTKDDSDEVQPLVPVDAKPAGRLSLEERKQLRKNIEEAGRDIYHR